MEDKLAKTTKSHQITDEERQKSYEKTYKRIVKEIEAETGMPYVYKTLEERWSLDGDMSGAITMHDEDPTWKFKAQRLAKRLQELRKDRKKIKKRVAANGEKRLSLTKKQRDAILLKTKERCHICGGKILKEEAWQADHVLAHAKGGSHAEENYLPAHSVCNRLRWHYGAEEIQLILQLGIWMRTQIEKEKIDAMNLAERFVKDETAKKSR
jgi:hypothetical protein